jgi:putative intracellular protease/amidase
MSDPLIADAYLQIRKVTSYWGTPREARVMRCTQTKPGEALPGCIVVKVKVRIPVEAWGPFEPEAVIDVPADLIQHPIEVEAVDPS